MPRYHFYGPARNAHLANLPRKPPDRMKTSPIAAFAIAPSLVAALVATRRADARLAAETRLWPDVIAKGEIGIN